MDVTLYGFGYHFMKHIYFFSTCLLFLNVFLRPFKTLKFVSVATLGVGLFWAAFCRGSCFITCRFTFADLLLKGILMRIGRPFRDSFLYFFPLVWIFRILSPHIFESWILWTSVSISQSWTPVVERIAWPIGQYRILFRVYSNDRICSCYRALREIIICTIIYNGYQLRIKWITYPLKKSWFFEV